jgi:hypothetical protein
MSPSVPVLGQFVGSLPYYGLLGTIAVILIIVFVVYRKRMQ